MLRILPLVFARRGDTICGLEPQLENDSLGVSLVRLPLPSLGGNADNSAQESRLRYFVFPRADSLCFDGKPLG